MRYATRIQNAAMSQVTKDNWVARMHWVYDAVPVSEQRTARPCS